MKKSGGEIKDLLLLEDKILETQQKIQDLGVNLGVYSSENSFCTIIFSMQEVHTTVTDGSFSVRFVLTCIKNAFFWTVFLYIVLIVFAAGALFGIWLLLYAYTNVKVHLSEKPSNFSITEDDNDVSKKE